MLQQLSPLARGRLTTLMGVLLLCTDTPTYRCLRLRLPVAHPHFGIAVCVWRGSTAAVSCAVSVAWLDDWSVVKLRAHLAALGTRNLLLASVLMAAASLAFTVGVAWTSAANVLVIIALGPLITAVMCRAILGIKLPMHSWVACVAGFASVALVFAGSMQAGQAAGCFMAAGCPLAFGAFLTLSTCVRCARVARFASCEPRPVVPRRLYVRVCCGRA
jgi:drug/metabolite transporter (DMT)-like permease